MAQGASPENQEGPYQLPSTIQNPETPESGWDRIKELFKPNQLGQYPEEVQAVVKSTITGAILGWVYGGVPAARQSREHYIRQSQAEIYQHKVEAVRSAHNAALRGFIRYGWRWSWRVAAFVTVFNSVSTGLSVYRDEVLLSNFAAAGAVTGGLFRFSLGLRGFLSGSLIGAFLGIPAGALISGLQTVSGESIRERKRRERRELYDHKLQEWSARINVTDQVLEDMETSNKEPLEQQVEKIKELLQQPRNQSHHPREER